MRFPLLISLSLFLCLLTLTPAALIQVDPETSFFVDPEGRVRLFHGVNAVYKIFPWHPQTTGFDSQRSLSEFDIKNLKEWGFNVVRLGMMWPGTEPQRGEYNQTYIQVMKGIVDALAKEGIYTILDAHQDLLSRYFCGEGIPDWAVRIDKDARPFAEPIGRVPLDEKGYPDMDECQSRVFSIYYLSQVVGNAFQNFYDDVDGIATAFGKFWSTVASHFRDHKSVLAYELINEPWQGDVFANPWLFYPGEAERVNLAPLYAKLHRSIREVDDKHILFYEQAVATVTQNGFTEGPGGPAYNDRQVFSYHIYCAPTEGGDPTNILWCNAVDELMFNTNMANVKRLGGGGFLSEFGAMSNSSIAIENLNFVTSKADYYLQSWTYWQFKLFEDITTTGPQESFYKGNDLEVEKVKALSRTYARATSGIPTHMSFDPLTALFELKFNLNTSISAPTEIYLNYKMHYPKGYTVALNPEGIAKWESVEPNIIHIVPTSNAVDGAELSVTISKK